MLHYSSVGHSDQLPPRGWGAGLGRRFKRSWFALAQNRWGELCAMRHAKFARGYVQSACLGARRSLYRSLVCRGGITVTAGGGIAVVCALAVERSGREDYSVAVWWRGFAIQLSDRLSCAVRREWQFVRRDTHRRDRCPSVCASWRRAETSVRERTTLGRSLPRPGGVGVARWFPGHQVDR